MGKTFAEVAAMDAWELAHWAALLRLEPPQGQLLRLLGAQLSSTVANTAFGSRGGYRLGDFLMDFERRQQPQTPQQQAAAWMAWTAHSGGEIRGKE